MKINRIKTQGSCVLICRIYAGNFDKKICYNLEDDNNMNRDDGYDENARKIKHHQAGQKKRRVKDTCT